MKRTKTTKKAKMKTKRATRLKPGARPNRPKPRPGAVDIRMSPDVFLLFQAANLKPGFDVDQGLLRPVAVKATG